MEVDGTPRIDHIFVSEEFTETSGYLIGRVKNMIYLQNEGNPDRPELSDHNLAVVTIELR